METEMTIEKNIEEDTILKGWIYTHIQTVGKYKLKVSIHRYTNEPRAGAASVYVWDKEKLNWTYLYGLAPQTMKTVYILHIFETEATFEHFQDDDKTLTEGAKQILF